MHHIERFVVVFKCMDIIVSETITQPSKTTNRKASQRFHHSIVWNCIIFGTNNHTWIHEITKLLHWQCLSVKMHFCGSFFISFLFFSRTRTIAHSLTSIYVACHSLAFSNAMLRMQRKTHREITILCCKIST